MIKFLINKYLEDKYTKNILKFGYTPAGVFWNSEYNQIKRYQELLDLIPDQKEKISLMDIGCGYGAFYQYLLKMNLSRKIIYYGIDINKNLIAECKRNFPNISFDEKPSKGIKVDYLLFSGTYNLAVINAINLWEKYILEDLYNYSKFCRKTILLNLQISDECKIINNIYYTTYKSITKLLTKQFKKFEILHSKYFKKDVILQIFLD